VLYAPLEEYTACERLLGSHDEAVAPADKRAVTDAASGCAGGRRDERACQTAGPLSYGESYSITYS
jgi:hypothetical protein